MKVMHMVIAKHKWEILPRQGFLSSHGIQSIARIIESGHKPKA